MDAVEYDFKEHLHRYAVWTAARAQRAFATTAIIKQAIDKIGLKEETFNLSFDLDRAGFDVWHSKICNNLKSVLKEKKQNELIAFGRAAKIINIYLKTTLIIPNCRNDYPLINNIHPPIDHILLKCLVSKELLSKEYLVPWTTMKEEVYSKIIIELRARGKFDRLWKAESCWKPEKEINQNNVSEASA